MILLRIVRLFNYYFIPALPLTINDECMHFFDGNAGDSIGGWRLRLIDRDSTYDYDACKRMSLPRKSAKSPFSVQQFFFPLLSARFPI